MTDKTGAFPPARFRAIATGFDAAGEPFAGVGLRFWDHDGKPMAALALPPVEALAFALELLKAAEAEIRRERGA